MKKSLFIKLFCLITILSTSQFSALAQRINNTSVGGLTVSDGVNAVFTHSNTAFKLTAQLTSSAEDGVAGETFSDFEWSIKNSASGFDGIASIMEGTANAGGTANSELSISGLSPGYYTFGAIGKTTGAICESPLQEFTVYVLAPLSIFVTSNSAIQEFCADELPTGFEFTASASFDSAVPFNTQTDLTSPTLDNFDLVFNWYKVAEGTPFNAGSATPIKTTSTSTATTQDVYDFDIANDANALETGSWNYYVTVAYNIKGYGPFEGALGGTTPTVIKITPKPGKPTITISSE